MEPKIFSSGKTRPGRGFSYLELKKANMNINTAKNLGLRVDKRRRTAYEENINLLKEKMKGKAKMQEKGEKKKGKKVKTGKGKKITTKTSSKIKIKTD